MTPPEKDIQPESSRLPLVKRLVVIAGPSCSGKSTLIARIQSGESVRLQQILGITDPLDWVYCHAIGLRRLSGMYAENLIVHYDSLARQSANGYPYLAGLLRNSEQVIFLTLHAPSDVLLHRNWLRLIEVGAEFFRRPKGFRRFLIRSRAVLNRYFLYRKPQVVATHYDRWFKFCEACEVSPHWVIETTGKQADEIHRRC